jgi:predicted Fe-Mo cluster-binding NifX family protein
LYETETGDFEAIDNAQNLNAVQGAGIQAAETISRHGAECLVTGHCGPKAFRTLGAAGIAVFLNARGTIAEAIEQFKAGTLPAALGPDVDGHWA